MTHLDPRLAHALRFLSIDGVENANSGHPGMPMGMADVVTALFTKYLKFCPQNPQWHNRDRFILSAGHGSILLYSLLYLLGYVQATLEELKTFRQLKSRMAGHPEYGHLDGVEVTTGPLGQGLSTAVGIALGERLLNHRFPDAYNFHTFVVASDGDLMEGITHEACSLAGHLNLGKLIVLFDDNGISIDGKTSLAISENTLMRFDAYGWYTQKVDGHSMEAIDQALENAKADSRPSLIACKTIIGWGAPTKADTHGVHGSPLGQKEVLAMKKAFEWPLEPFAVPDDILQTWRKIGKKHQKVYEDSQKNAPFNPLSLDPIVINQATSGLMERFHQEKPLAATRSLSQEVINTLAPLMPNLIGGSADLTTSCNTKSTSAKSLTPTDFSGSYLHYGIREHGMAAAMNGLALTGFIPYGGTFLVFSDYLKPALRLSCLMNLGVIYVLTHDSIGLGEDGPTHQPIEHLAHLRCIPNLLVMRPCDGAEVIESWMIALKNRHRPSALILSRQQLPYLRQSKDSMLTQKGAYFLEEENDARMTLIATGSEVMIAVQVKEILKNKGISANVVSMPCMELFKEQPSTYQEKILGTEKRIIIEAAIEGVWSQFLREGDIFIGMKSFGASAPANDLYAHFGITAQAIVEKIEAF